MWDSAKNVQTQVEDRSKLVILPNNSLNGHSNIWDFSTPYSATIKTAYAVGGDISLTATTTQRPVAAAKIKTSPVLQNVTVESSSTNLASTELFDPTGTTTFAFYEDIDMNRSSIDVKGLKKMMYGKKCEDADGNNYAGDCAKVDDKSQIIMTFDSSIYKRGEKVPVTFKKLIKNLVNLPSTLTKTYYRSNP